MVDSEFLTPSRSKGEALPNGAFHEGGPQEAPRLHVWSMLPAAAIRKVGLHELGVEHPSLVPVAQIEEA